MANVRTVDLIPRGTETERLAPGGYWNSPSMDGGAIPSEPASPLTGMLLILRKQLRLILGVTFLTFLAALVYCIFADRLYRAKTTLEIRGYAPILQDADFENLIGKDTRRIEYSKTTIAKLKQYIVADKALQKNNLAEDVRKYFETRKPVWSEWAAPLKTWVKGLGLPGLAREEEEMTEGAVKSPFMHSESFLRAYLGLLSTTPVNQTTLVDIIVTTTDPALTQKIANTHAGVFIDHLRGERQDELRENLTALEQHAGDLQRRLRDVEESAAAYARDQQILALPDSRGEELTQKNVGDIKELLSQATAKRIKSESLLREVEKKGVNSAAVLDDPSIRDLTMRLKDAQAQYAALNGKVTPLFPAVMELQARMGSLREAIKQQREQRLDALRSEYNSDLTTEVKLQEQVERESRTANDFSRKLVHYNLLMREAGSLRELADTVNKELKRTQISAESTKSNIYVSDYAALPKQPYSPKIKIILIASLLFGGVLGYALSLIREVTDSRLEGSDDVQRCLGLAALGSLPSFTLAQQEASPRRFIALGRQKRRRQAPEMQVEPASPPAENAPAVVRQLVTVTAPHASVSEALRTIRAGVLFSSADNPAKVILVTSSTQSEGKTTVAANLAVSLAQASFSTVLIDADLRNPSASWYFGIPPFTSGLVNYLTGHTKMEDIVVPTEVPSLSIIPTGALTPNPAELVGSRKMAELMKMLSAHYEYVIVDSPPVISVADSLMLSRAVDTVLFVVRSGKTQRPVAEEAVRRLRRVGAHILGTVVNDVSKNGRIYSMDNYLFEEAPSRVFETAA